ncbi:MAG: DUF3794 domain-containing protein [Acutalibacter sp.]|nr:DUF3794 domain-containing protein [Acutalibacter sp.]
MQAKIKTQPYEYFDPIFDGSFEAPIDTEYNLPDYCPDIQKILKCQAVPEVSSYLISEDTLTVDGVCDIRVLYLDSKGDRVYSCDFTKDFTASVKIKATEEKAVAYIQSALDHITCRAVSARRVDMHIAISLKALVVVQKQELITCDMGDDSVEKLCSTYSAAQAVNAVCHQFTTEDTLSLKNGKPPIETILRKNVTCRVSDYRLSDGKMEVTGTADVCFLYQSAVDGTSLEKMNATIEFSQSIDCSGAEEGCICDLKAVVGDSSIQPREDDVGEYTNVNIVVKIFLVAFLYKPCEIEVIDDAYSVRAPLELRYSQTSFLQIDRTHTEVLKKKSALTVSEDEIEKVLDIWCEQDSVQTVCDKGKLNYRVRYTVCMLYQSSGGRVLYTEKPFDYNAATELGDSQTRKTDTFSRTELWEYRITDKNTVEISVETPTSTFLYSRTSVKYLTSAGVNEDAPAFETEPKLLVYYASAGERLWDIAKNHRALLSDIQAQNDLYDEVVPTDRPIIICNR